MAFDVAVVPLQAEDEVLEIFHEGAQIIVATSRQLHFLSEAGVLARTVSLELPAVETAVARDVSMGLGGFGAVLETHAEDVRTYFCQIDPEAGLSADRCTLLVQGFASLVDSRLEFNGTHYVWYRLYEGTMRRYRFQLDGALLDETDLWQDAATSGRFVDATSTPSMEVFVTTGADCASFLHRWTPSEHTIEPYALPTLVPDWSGGRFAMAGDSLDATAHLQFLQCRGEAGCDVASTGLLAMVTRFDVPTGAVSRVPVALRSSWDSALIVDGPDTAVVYPVGYDELRVSRFDATGVAEVSEVHLPLSYAQTGIELQYVGAGRAIGPGDYVFVYEGTGNAGRDRRVARFTIP